MYSNFVNSAQVETAHDIAEQVEQEALPVEIGMDQLRQIAGGVVNYGPGEGW